MISYFCSNEVGIFCSNHNVTFALLCNCQGRYTRRSFFKNRIKFRLNHVAKVDFISC